MAKPDTKPLLELRGIGRSFRTGESTLKVLDGVSLDIRAGEFVAIMGQSGSGKSTLMNIIGCLDRPSEGQYTIHGQDVAALDPDALAALRRQTFGFIFQRYNLLANATAAENVEVPAIYAGEGPAARRGRVSQLLERLGLGNRQDHRPGQLSGGQQQRVAIARALMNNPPVILADEPTGALDSKSGQEVMQLLKDLNAEGRTIILITHDAGVAAHAHRQVRIADGRIVDDSCAGKHQPRAEADAAAALEGAAGADRHAGGVLGTAEAVKIALRALRVSLFRTSLTLLGIVIGVAAVVTLMAVGSGSRDEVLSQISAMGTNLLSIRPGAPELRSSGDVATLTQADAAALRELSNVSSAVAQRDGRFTVRHGNTDYATTISGVEPDLPNLRDWPVGTGSFFTERDIQGYAPVIVLGQTVVDALFPDGDDPIGAYVLVGNIPFEVIGTMEAKGAGGGGMDQDDTAFVPLTTGLVRLFGQAYVSGISVKVADVNRIDDTQEAMRQLLISRHRTEDFRIRNMASILDAANSTLTTLTLLLATIAAISLLVGGIGVMNIMLVSVTERTREIGIRMATGARRWDILLQFTTEAAVVGTLGGIIGVVLGLLIAVVLKLFGVPVAFSIGPSLMAFGSAFATGLVFGWWPARRASRLDPVVALSTD